MKCLIQNYINVECGTIYLNVIFLLPYFCEFCFSKLFSLSILPQRSTLKISCTSVNII